jgi:hypothetical protein
MCTAGTSQFPLSDWQVMGNEESYGMALQERQEITDRPSLGRRHTEKT